MFYGDDDDDDDNDYGGNGDEIKAITTKVVGIFHISKTIIDDTPVVAL